jgi:hypothetical protein
MSAASLKRKMAFVSAVAGLCCALAGCAADIGAQPATPTSHPLRYYGGPKSPMWPSQ